MVRALCGGRRTEEDDMDPRLVELVRGLLSRLAASVVCIVDDDLPTRVEEVPDELLAPDGNLLPQRDGFCALLA